MNFTETLEKLLKEKAKENYDNSLSWPKLCASLLALEPNRTTPFGEITRHLYDCINSCLLNLNNDDHNVTQAHSRFEKGLLERPFYLALAEMLETCIFKNLGEFPESLKTSKLFMLENKNLSRLDEIEEEMKHLYNNVFINATYPLNDEKERQFSKFLFEFLTPKDLNTFLGLRTTVGSAPQLPPSLQECLESFTKIYVKKSAKPKLNRSKAASFSANTLTVGAKAHSKHFHRDVSDAFWGTCTGTEKQKNEQANRVLAKIITNAAWINLHSLPHDTRVYEVRNEQGYGARWEIYDPIIKQANANPNNIDSDDENDNKTLQISHNIDKGHASIIFRGFLEPQMLDGHAKGWVH
ncbi:7613_t:CDS:2 [Ambispora leptoticha]|uniref:7613_t:CDS:1 n=1 Tax=Ambispora leptoticha TaxID=144679 RepID=A0A9N8WES5_9GLOM|nr:7613_t:CDS:2 [Ambispora leptoticha]